MYSNTKKRKRRTTPQYRQQENTEEPSLKRYQNLSYEADLQDGTRAYSLARSLESNEGTEIGGALNHWELGSEDTHEESWGDDAEDIIILGTVSTPTKDTSHGHGKEGQSKDVRLDKYGTGPLLDAPPSRSPPPSTSRLSPPSPSVDSEGWSDLSSDTEDTKSLSPSAITEYRNEKRRKMLDRMREERLQARIREDEENEKGKDEDEGEPTETQLNLMRRTANHLLTSPNPVLLEIRILANHGADERFAFLRGTRWKATWDEIKKAAKEERERELREKEEKQRSGGLGFLAGYQSDSESAEGSNEDDRETTEKQGE